MSGTPILSSTKSNTESLYHTGPSRYRYWFELNFVTVDPTGIISVGTGGISDFEQENTEMVMNPISKNNLVILKVFMALNLKY